MMIFLDLDGVLTTRKHVFPFEKISDQCPLDPNCVEWFNKLIENFNFKIILTSTWRHFHDIDTMNIKFKESGVKDRILDYTPEHKCHSPQRGKEILMWIEQNPEFKGQPYFVIDDEMWTIEPHIEAEHLIHITHGWVEDGFNAFYYNQLADRINNLT